MVTANKKKDFSLVDLHLFIDYYHNLRDSTNSYLPIFFFQITFLSVFFWEGGFSINPSHSLPSKPKKM